MQKDLQYYLNHRHGLCVTIPKKKQDYLERGEYLSEFVTQEEKDLVLENLGITHKLDELKERLDRKVIELGGIAWDDVPTEGHTELVLSSDSIWKALQNFKSNEFIDNLIQTLWNNILSRIDKIDLDIKEDLQNFIPTFVKNEINKCILDLLNQIDSLDIHGIAVSNEFGSNSHIGVSQKTLTEAFNKLWQKIEDMTGEQIQGIQMVVTPEYFISEDGCQVHISANTVETNDVFEHIAFYINGELIAEADNTDLFEYETSITETSVIKCVAKIMGIEYTQQKVVTHYNSFWLGAGSVYTDIMDVDHVIPITNGMRGAYDIDVADGQKIIIIVGDSLKDGFLRADLNSVEIPFTETSVTVDGSGYRVYMSEPWSAGNYNIDING